jgi:haloalkane dehalogenase
VSLTENKISVGSLTWFYRQGKLEETSNKSPVILLHGLPSQSFSWCEIMVSLAEYGYQGIAPDWIGCGFSAQPDKRDFNYTPDSYVKALAELIETLGLNKISLVVQGFLGSVGLQYALRYPEVIDQLVILNTPLAPSVKVPWQMRQWGLPLIGDMLTQDPLLIDRSLEGGSGFVISEANLMVYRKPFLTASAAGRALMSIVKNLNLPSAMTEINTGLGKWEKPTRIIWGVEDPWLEISEVENLVKTNPKLELIKLEEAKHYPQEHWSKEIAPMILNFLR